MYLATLVRRGMIFISKRSALSYRELLIDDQQKERFVITTRISIILLPLLLLQACAAVEDSPTRAEPACGPKVSHNSVRIIDARDEFASGGIEAAIRRAEASVGRIQMLDRDVHRTVHFAALKGNGAKRGCDVVIHVLTQKNVDNTGWDGHLVLLARRSTGSVE